MASGSQVKFLNDHMLVKLLNAAKSTDKCIIHDENGFDKTYTQLLADIAKTRDILVASLPPTSFNAQGLLDEASLYIGVVTSSAYEFIVSFSAIRAVGGACMPFAPSIPVEQAHDFLSRTKSVCILSGKSHMEKSNEIAQKVYNDGGDIPVLRISSSAPPLPTERVDIDYSLQVHPLSPGLVVFTSGTTGTPKGAVLPNCWMSIPSRLEPDSGTISHRPAYYIGGAASLLAPLFAGIEIYAMKDPNDARHMWELLKEHKITHMGLNPGLLRQLRSVYLNELTGLPDEELQRYVNGIKNVRKLSSSGTILSPELEEFWTNLSGTSFEILYGSTETGLVALKADAQRPNKVKHSIGVPWPGVKIKLSEGDHGEILVKHPMIFTHYLGDEDATRNAFDAEGYVKTGDLAHIVDGEYICDGRVNDDFIQLRDHRISTVEVEEELEGLSYISEVYVVPVPSDEAGQSCGALIRPGKGTAPEDITLDRIKADLPKTFPEYKHPQCIRVMKDGEVVPFTVSRKPIKREIAKQFFGAT